jgi:tetratricopeptide (TPR) repeat protein
MTLHILIDFLTSGWDAAKLIGAIAGMITIFGGGYGLYWRISTAAGRRLKMLHSYIEAREREITAKRAAVLQSIRLSEHFQLDQEPLDVSGEIDEVIELLDEDRLKQATEALIDLEERLEKKEKLVRDYANELVTHRASVNVFIAALADRRKRSDQGLEHVGAALAIDRKDKDALKYQGWLFLRKNNLPDAEDSFLKLKQLSVGPENDQYRCDAWEGLGFTYRAFGFGRYGEAEKAFGNAIGIIKQLSGNDKDGFVRGRIHDALGDLYADASWGGHSVASTVECYQRAIAAFTAEGKSNNERTARLRSAHAVKVKLEKLQKGIQAELLS